MSTININSNPVISDRHQNPLANNKGAPAKRENFTAFAVLSIISTILFVVLVIVLWTEWTAIKFA
jgi:hypothetical protein